MSDQKLTLRTVWRDSGQPTIADLTAGLSLLLSAIYAEHDVNPTADLLLNLYYKNLGTIRNLFSPALQKRRVAKFWPSEEVESCPLSFTDQTRLCRYKSIATPETRVRQATLLVQHELLSSTWCFWIQVWQGAAICDTLNDNAHISYRTCGNDMDPFGHHSLANCGSRYDRTARLNHVSGTSDKRSSWRVAFSPDWRK